MILGSSEIWIFVLEKCVVQSSLVDVIHLNTKVEGQDKWIVFSFLCGECGSQFPPHKKKKIMLW